jgi:hypothetical protein
LRTDGFALGHACGSGRILCATLTTASTLAQAAFAASVSTGGGLTARSASRLATDVSSVAHTAFTSATGGRASRAGRSALAASSALATSSALASASGAAGLASGAGGAARNVVVITTCEWEREKAYEQSEFKGFMAHDARKPTPTPSRQARLFPRSGLSLGGTCRQTSAVLLRAGRYDAIMSRFNT